MAARNARNARNTARTPVAAPAPQPAAPSSQPAVGLKITNPQLREIARMVSEILKADIRAVQSMQARAAAAQQPARVAEPAAQLAAKPERKRAQQPAKPVRNVFDQDDAHDPAEEPQAAAAFGLLSERFAVQVGKAASHAWCDIAQLRWDWTSEAAPNVVRLTLSGDHAERASMWAARWCEVQPEVRGFEYLGRAASGTYTLRIGLRSPVVVPWE